MTEPLLWCIGGEAAWSRVEEGDKGRDDMLEEEGIVEILKEVDEFLEFECGCELCLWVGGLV